MFLQHLDALLFFPPVLIVGLDVFRGNGASVARIVPYAALHYMAYEQYRRWIVLTMPDIGRGPVLDLVAGSIAGGTAVLVTYPLDLVRTKLAYQVTSFELSLVLFLSLLATSLSSLVFSIFESAIMSAF